MEHAEVPVTKFASTWQHCRLLFDALWQALRRGMTAEQFAYYDVNGDGFITSREIHMVCTEHLFGIACPWLLDVGV